MNPIDLNALSPADREITERMARALRELNEIAQVLAARPDGGTSAVHVRHAAESVNFAWRLLPLKLPGVAPRAT